MTLKETLKQLKALGNEKVRKQNAKSGAGDNQFGVSLGDIRVLAKKIRTNHELALSLWETGNVDAQFLATLLIEPEEAVGRGDGSDGAVHHLCARGGLAHRLRRPAAPRQGGASPGLDGRGRPLGGPRRMGPHRRAGREESGRARPPGAAGSHRVRNGERRSGSAVDDEQHAWPAIGIHFPKHRKRAIAIGETLGIYRDYPVSKGCTSPFAPIWIGEMVRRKG